MVFLTSLLALYLAWNLGANDVANSMGTSVGSKAITLRQALLIAGILEFAGAVLFGRQVSNTLATQIINPNLFADIPQTLVLGMTAVLLACGIWLNIATAFGLPVSSSHAIVGAIAGFGCVAISPQVVDWQSVRTISLTWVLTPGVSAAIAALFYSLIKRWILDHPQATTQLREWIPWLSSALFSILGVIVLPTLSQPLQRILVDRLHLVLPAHDLPLLLGALAATSLSIYGWQQLERETLAMQSPHSSVESLLARFQLLSACFVAFAHGSNDVGNAIAPLAVIISVLDTGLVPSGGLHVPLWILMLGGLGIVAGLAVWGSRVIGTIGENIIPLQPSGGFCAELATAATVLMASRLGLPVSTSHALVGAVFGIGLVQNLRAVQFRVLGTIGLAWVTTIPIAAALAALLFVTIHRLVGN